MSADALLRSLPPNLVARNPHVAAVLADRDTARSARFALLRFAEGAAALEVSIHGLRLVPAVNAREHWSARARRTSRERRAVTVALLGRIVPALPLDVVITRIGPRRLDDDNATGAAKGVRDAIARCLGIDDGDARVRYRVEQRRGEPRRYGVEIRIAPATMTTAPQGGEVLGTKRYPENARAVLSTRVRAGVAEHRVKGRVNWGRDPEGRPTALARSDVRARGLQAPRQGPFGGVERLGVVPEGSGRWTGAWARRRGGGGTDA